MARNVPMTHSLKLAILLLAVLVSTGLMTSCSQPTAAGDVTSPTVAITSTSSDPTGVSPIDVSIVFSEEVTGFDESDLVAANATVEALSFTTADNTTFTLNLVPDALELTVTLDIAAGACTDAAGNPNTAATQFSRLYTALPIPLISSTASDPTNVSPLPITITFDKAVENFEAGDLTLVNCSIDTFTETVPGTEWTIGLLPGQGLVEVTVPAGVCDEAGISTVTNAASTTFSITFDSVGPGGTLTTTAVDPTNTSPIPITITFDEPVASGTFTAGDITVSGGSAGNLQTADDTVFTADVTPSAQGAVDISLDAGVCTDALGNLNTAAATSLSLLYDSDPTAVITSTTQNRTGASPIAITITFNEAVTGLDAGDLTVGNGTAGAVAGGPTVYTCDITPTAAGALTVDLAAGMCDDTDWAANPNVAAAQFTRTYITAPGVGTSGRGRSTTASSVSLSTTVAAGNANNVLIAEVSVESSSTVPSITGVTYGAVAMTLVTGSAITYTNGSNQHMVAALYYLKNPAEGTANITASFDGTYAFLQIGAIPLYDAYVHGGNDPIGAVATADGGASTFVITSITTLNDRSLLVDWVAGNADSGTGQSMTATPPQTKLGQQRSTDGCSANSTKAAATAGSNSMRWDLNQTMSWCLLDSVAEIKVAQ